MKRRRFISSVTLILPAAIIGSDVLFSSCKSELKKESFTQDDINLLNDIGETIIPASSTSPGAKAAKVGEFMKVYVTDCYNAEDRETFIEGINTIKTLSKSKYGMEFLKLTASQKQELLNLLEKEAREYGQHKRKPALPAGDAIQTGKAQEEKMKVKAGSNHYYLMMKELTLLGYFTSEVGATQALRYIQTPGSYKGDIPFEKGDKAWAS